MSLSLFYLSTSIEQYVFQLSSTTKHMVPYGIQLCRTRRRRNCGNLDGAVNTATLSAGRLTWLVAYFISSQILRLRGQRR